MSLIKKLINRYSVNLKNAIYFFMPSIIGLLINLITFPVFSEKLSSYDFAVIGYFEAISQMFLPIMNLSFYSFYMMGFFNRTEEENRRVMATLIMFLTLINLAIILLGLTFLFLYFNWANVTFSIYPYGILTLASLYFMIYVSFLGLDFKMKKEGLKFLVLQSVNIILSIGIGLYLVIVLELGAAGRMLGVLLSQIILGMIAFKMTFIKAKIDFKIIKKALAFGYPLIIIALLDIPTQYIDRIMLERQNDVDAFALYSIGLKMSGIIFMLGSAVYQAFEPDFYKYVSQKNPKIFIQILGFVFGFFLMVNIIFSIFAEPLISLLTSNRYTGAYQYAIILIWSDFFLLFSYALSIILIVNNKTKLLLYRKLIIALLGVALFIFFINYWRFFGAGFAKIIINFLNCAILVYFIWLSSRRTERVEKSKKKATMS
ncbi:hypothetical protein V7127_20555 [Bacillus sp. JJ1773]|uniref:lipopolysaccharide biosynthesis protein n=1 Tax=Bacillus sp. JJ1773 TaxID=3122965 RepID=UPI002FFF3CD9